ncbi:preprotein translocase subunit SecD [Motilibacter rhizosphaerae]|uniref:Protein translocase subunit SecD n=1 Tax=Motilibacter rhizosphaerae TaxID=598652 RepID=A0A4Q7NRP3_9ACTN|nr:protein translocase subunit SecD [Motilibacter rhizosphaerae]RZS89438.1 preprotein translocase subunit SecD [Motilibacter rhizosphaerae]
MARSQQSRSTRPGKALGLMVLVLAVLFGGIGLGVAFGKDASWAPKLGLDLEGGSTITLTPQATQGSKVTGESINEAISIIRQRIDAAGVGESEVTAQGTGTGRSIVVSVPGKQDNALLKAASQTAQLRIRQVLATASDPSAAATASPSASSSAGSATGSASATASASASASPSPSTSGQGRAPSAALAAATPSASGAAITATAATATPAASPTETTVAASAAASAPASSAAAVPVTPASDLPALAKQLAAQAAAGQDVTAALAGAQCPPGDQVPYDQDDANSPVITCYAGGKFLLAKADLVGKDVSDAYGEPEPDSRGNATNTWQVTLKFTGAGATKWGNLTERVSSQALQNAQLNYISVELDGKIISNATVTQRLGGDSRITGNFSVSQAQQLGRQIKFGALPLSFTQSDVQTVSASLGSDQLRGGLIAGGIGLLLVVLYSLLYYRGLGLISVASLVVSAVTTYGLVAFLSNQMGYRLSLPGIAGLIVAIGITADSFIVYFERLRDEVREGRTLRVAVETGWSRARRTILTADFVSFLAAAVLYVISVGSVKGFAFTLGLTTIVDVVIVFLFTKPLVTLAARHDFFTGGHPWSGLDPRRLGAKPRAAVAAPARPTRPSLSKEA